MLLKINMKTEIKKRGGISVPRAPVVGLCYINTMYVKWEWNWELNDQCICTRTNLYLKGQSLTCYVIDKFMCDIQCLPQNEIQYFAYSLFWYRNSH